MLKTCYNLAEVLQVIWLKNQVAECKIRNLVGIKWPLWGNWLEHPKFLLLVGPIHQLTLSSAKWVVMRFCRPYSGSDMVISGHRHLRTDHLSLNQIAPGNRNLQHWINPLSSLGQNGIFNPFYRLRIGVHCRAYCFWWSQLALKSHEEGSGLQ